ncbi:tRNA (adenine(58)-N(1))-methyltransferase non-catalytic subunit [Coccomyxa sp. Obi]|nr:tRNA (adenine(58)-N(1))-methyltransferase non-catalytic subunit [Coccomyxa sp. Obi]
MEPCIIREGDNAVLDINGSYKTFVTVKRGSKVKMGKAMCCLDSLIGQYYGIQFELAADGQTLVFKRPKLERDDVAMVDKLDANGTMNKNNSELLDRGDANQNLKAKDIEAMREAGMGGEAIVEALLANSETYESKTHFAQAKYRKRKADKYMAQATLIRPTARSVAEAYFGKSPQKIQCMRADTLALLLSLANIGAHARVLVVETCGGLVTGAVAERMGGTGLIVSGYTGLKAPSLDVVQQFNFPASSKASMVTAPIKALLQCRSQPATEGVSSGADQPAAAEEALSAQPAQDTAMADAGTGEQAGDAHTVPLTKSPGTDATIAVAGTSTSGVEAAGNGQNSTAGAEEVARTGAQGGAQQVASTSGSGRELPEAVQQACRQGFDCCILASPLVQPLALLRKVLPLLAPSAAFAVFSNYLQPLAECMLALQVSKEALAVQLQEAWWREHQVLPGRTHPEMVISATGGYILTGYKVAPPS